MKINVWLFTFLIFFIVVSKSFADSADGFPNVPGKEAELAKLVGEVYVWNHWWFQDWKNNFDKNFELGKREVVGVCFNGHDDKENMGYNIFFDKLIADISFFKQADSWYVPGIVDDYQSFVGSGISERSEYFEFEKKQLCPIKEFTVVFNKDVFNVLDFGKFTDEKKKFVEKSLMELIFTKKRLNWMKKNLDVIPENEIVIKVGNFNFNYPVFYYYIVGLNYDGGYGEEVMPYLGFVYFDIKSRKAFCEDFIASDGILRRKYKNAISRIDQTSATLYYKNGKFVDK